MGIKKGMDTTRTRHLAGCGAKPRWASDPVSTTTSFGHSTFTPPTRFLILYESRLSPYRNENPPMKRKTAITSPAPDLPEGYPEFIVSLKQRIRSAQVKAALSVNRELVLLYWQIGNDILTRQEREGWGTKVIDRLSSDLIHEFPEMKGFSVRNLKYMRKFAESWCDLQFVQEFAAQITWYHHIASYYGRVLRGMADFRAA